LWGHNSIFQGGPYDPVQPIPYIAQKYPDAFEPHFDTGIRRPMELYTDFSNFDTTSHPISSADFGM
jgi:hypothetical protein